MDIELLRTFLEVNRTGHFGNTADNLYLTQSAVSARIKQLEDTLGTILFERQRNNIRLTAAGKRFLPHAETIVGTWQRARQESGLEDNLTTLLSVAGLSDLWEKDLLDWIVRIRTAAPDIAIHAAAQTSPSLVQQTLNGSIDLAFLFEPQPHPDISTRFMKRMDLIMVSSEKGLSVVDALARDYIMIDWGTAYAVAHARYFPDAPSAPVYTSHGSLGMSYILHNGGAAYLPENWCSSLMREDKLHPVKDAPVIGREVHAIWRSSNPKNSLIQEALDLFKA